MKISQAAALVGLDEVATVRPVPITDDDLNAMQPPARAPQPSTSPQQPPRRERRIRESRSR